MRRGLAVGFAIVCVIVIGLVVATASPVGSNTEKEDPPEPTERLEVNLADMEPFDEEMTARDFDTTRFEITVHSNGDATWTFRYERYVDFDEREAFEAYLERFQEEELAIYDGFIDQATVFTEKGSEATGREMTVEDITRDGGFEQRLNLRGYVELSFRWTNFAETHENTLVISDVFDIGLFLGEEQSLMITLDDDLEFANVYPSPSFETNPRHDNGSLLWRGEMEFEPGHPHLVIAEVDQDEGVIDAIRNELTPLRLGIVGAFVFAVVLGSWYRFRGRIVEVPTFVTGEAEEEQTTSIAEVTASEGISEQDLLSDEDRVIELLELNGGRMKQVEIVEETDWSKSKVSMILSEMEEEDEIEKLRVGRENIISLAGYSPEAARSPFEDIDA